MKRLLLLLILCVLVGVAVAQDIPPLATADPTPIVVQVTTFEPTTLIAGTVRSVTIFGANFTAQTTVRFVGMGLMKVTFVNRTTLLIDVPETFPIGTYALEVSDPTQGQAVAASLLRVVGATPVPLPTETPAPIPTLPIPALPTAIPGKPMLITRNFSASSSAVKPGSSVTLTFEVVNGGNQAALGVSVALTTGSKFLPANGQAGATLPDIFPGAAVSVSLTIDAALDAPNGPNNVPFTLTYRSPDGEVITSAVNLSVNVVAPTAIAQVTIARYRYVPSTVQPNDSLTVTLLITNTGSETARGVLVKVGKDGILLPGENGDSVAVGDLAPNGSLAVDMPLIVKQDAKAGMQLQPMTITYFRGSSPDVVEVSSSITLDIHTAATQAPLILLKNYTVKVGDERPEFLTPGQRFTLDFTVQNLGNVALKNVLVAFGTVETTGGTTTGGDSTGGTGGGTTTTIQPSVTFAPLGSGGTLFVEALAAGGSVNLTQDFIVNGTTKSGIYSLPISLNYRDVQGEKAQTSLNASLVVVVLPRLQVILPAPLPTEVYIGEPLPLTVTIKNVSGVVVRLTDYEVTTSNGTVSEGASGILANVPVDDEATINAMIMPDTEGDTTITLVVHFLDDLNQTRERRETYTVNASAAPSFEQPPIEETPVVETPVPTEPLTFGRMMLALLGLGS